MLPSPEIIYIFSPSKVDTWTSTSHTRLRRKFHSYYTNIGHFTRQQISCYVFITNWPWTDWWSGQSGGTRFQPPELFILQGEKMILFSSILESQLLEICHHTEWNHAPMNAGLSRFRLGLDISIPIISSQCSVRPRDHQTRHVRVTIAPMEVKWDLGGSILSNSRRVWNFADCPRQNWLARDHGVLPPIDSPQFIFSHVMSYLRHVRHCNALAHALTTDRFNGPGFGKNMENTSSWSYSRQARWRSLQFIKKRGTWLLKLA